MIMIDTHAHAYSTYIEGLTYVPKKLISVEQYLYQLDQHDIRGGVLIQPSFLGFDNSYLLHSLEKYPHQLRGVVVLKEETSFDVLQELDKKGVRGIRLNLFNQFFQINSYEPLFEKIHQLNWHVEIYAQGEHLIPTLNSIHNKSLKVVIDHFGLPQTLQDEHFQCMLQSHLNLYVKLSAPYRFACRLLTQAIELIIKHRGIDKILWGSDYPFTRFEEVFSYQQSLDFLPESILSLKENLTNNAKTLFQF